MLILNRFVDFLPNILYDKLYLLGKILEDKLWE
jgi:hypothetical protein